MSTATTTRGGRRTKKARIELGSIVRVAPIAEESDAFGVDSGQRIS